MLLTSVIAHEETDEIERCYRRNKSGFIRKLTA